MIYGVTGIFGSGKTTVAKILSENGYIHVNADNIGHHLLKRTEIKSKIVKRFGKKILTNNKIDRNKLKKIVFYNKNELVELNKIIHPLILKEIKLKIKNRKNVIIDAALLIESGALGFIDKLIVVKINKVQHINRLNNKKKYTTEEIQNILKSQLNQKEKLKYADIIIDNSRSIDSTKKQILKHVKCQK
ncbi:MAG: dephospho-CoA kinase [Nanoarchaeota archaeon]